ncbi:MAG: hypothetical protein E7378_00810 [Clostridiales bacterium]|nr:hypothetical protein [Clostridiales bacterium]
MKKNMILKQSLFEKFTKIVFGIICAVCVGCGAGIIVDNLGAYIQNSSNALPPVLIPITTPLEIPLKDPTNTQNSVNNPYYITTKAHLNNLSAYVCDGGGTSGKYFELGADIDYGNGNFTPIGTRVVKIVNEDPDDPIIRPIASIFSSNIVPLKIVTTTKIEITYFNGYFDGKNHTISNMRIEHNASDSTGCLGLFGYVSGNATIKNCKISNIIVTSEGDDAGGFIGNIQGFPTISNLHYLGGSVSLTSGSVCIGGIIGYAAIDTEQTLSDCSNAATITATTTESSNVGGIIGRNDKSEAGFGFNIQNCKNSGSISAGNASGCVGSYRAGGIVGRNDYGSISVCMNTANVTAGYEEVENYGSKIGVAGGIVGMNGTSLISNCYNGGNVSAYCKVDKAQDSDYNSASAIDKSLITFLGENKEPSSYKINWYLGNIGGTEYYCEFNEASDGINLHVSAGGDVKFKAKEKRDITTKSGTAYAGGIAGETSDKVSNCVNWGASDSSSNITSTGYRVTINYDILYYKEIKRQISTLTERPAGLLIEVTIGVYDVNSLYYGDIFSIDFDYRYSAGEEIANLSSTGSVENCYSRIKKSNKKEVVKSFYTSHYKVWDDEDCGSCNPYSWDGNEYVSSNLQPDITDTYTYYGIYSKYDFDEDENGSLYDSKKFGTVNNWEWHSYESLEKIGVNLEEKEGSFSINYLFLGYRQSNGKPVDYFNTYEKVDLTENAFSYTYPTIQYPHSSAASEICVQNSIGNLDASYWTTSSWINNGYPHLKYFYHEDNI